LLLYKISIITGQHLVSNPRVWKEANALASVGHHVTVFTTAYSQNNFDADKCLLTDNVQYQLSCSLIPSLLRFPFIFYAKAIKKSANLFFRLFKITSIYQEVYLPRLQLNVIKRSKSDLMICHQETGLLLGVELIKMGFNVSFDFEDWYSEDYPHINRPASLLKKAEAYALMYGKYVTCPSKSMSLALSKMYDTNSDLKVIYNSFPVKQLSNELKKKIPNSLVWFSQTIGPNRGIEQFLLALHKLYIPVNIHFIGNCTNEFKNELLGIVQGTPHQIEVHTLLTHDELMDSLQKFEIGLALELDFPLNRKYTVSNKILTYLQLNLHVFASSTDGQIELQGNFKNQITYINLANQKDISDKVTQLLNQRAYSLNGLFPEEYSWECQQKEISSLVNKAVTL